MNPDDRFYVRGIRKLIIDRVFGFIVEGHLAGLSFGVGRMFYKSILFFILYS
jgi:hypothetical protein